jgi:hypothetical protein
VQRYDAPRLVCRVPLGLNVNSSYDEAKAAAGANSEARAFAVVARNVAWFPANEQEYKQALGQALRLVSMGNIQVIGTTYDGP